MKTGKGTLAQCKEKLELGQLCPLLKWLRPLLLLFDCLLIVYLNQAIDVTHNLSKIKVEIPNIIVLNLILAKKIKHSFITA